MKTPPEMLSTKDTSYINDILRIILVTYKKINDTIPTLQDEDVKTQFENAATLLSTQYNTVLNLLK